MHKKRILILGAGVGGMEVYKALHNNVCGVLGCGVDLTVVNDENYYTFVPMLHEAATGGVDVDHVVTPVREIVNCHRHNFLKRKIIFIDIDKMVVKTTEDEIKFDIVAIALGARPNYFGIPGAQKYSFSIRTARDAEALRLRLNSLFELVANNLKEHARHPIQIAITGGGPVGVEVAGQIVELLHDVSKLYPGVMKNLFKISIIHGGDRLLPMSHPRLSRWAEEKLKKMGVDVRHKTYVSEVGEDHVKFRDGTKFSCAFVVWATGFEPNTLGIMDPAYLDDKGFVKIDTTMVIQKREYAFAVGDNARIYTLGQPMGPYMLAEAAYDGAQIVAKNILRTLRGKHELAPFRFKSKGSLIPIGDWFALAELFGVIRFKGRFAWWLRRTVYLVYVYSWRDKIRIAVEWTLDVFGTRDTTVR